MMNKVYGYVRVSTKKQTVENQKYEINQHYTNVDEWFEETKSGTIDYQNRILNKLLKKLKSGDILVVSELSRLGRSLYMIMEILNKLSIKGVMLHSIKENFKLDNEISSKVVSFAFSLVAEIERNMISQRTKEALAYRREMGMTLGRPKNSSNKQYKLDSKRERIIKYLNQGKTIYYISKKLHCNYNSLSNYINRFELKY